MPRLRVGLVSQDCAPLFRYDTALGGGNGNSLLVRLKIRNTYPEVAMERQALAAAMFAILVAPFAIANAQEPKPINAVKQELTDQYGDPLPEGAVARFGTVRFRHPFWVTGVAYSADGKVLASSCWEPVVRLWDPGSGKELRAFRPKEVTPGLALM